PESLRLAAAGVGRLLAAEPRAADARIEHAANASDDANRRERGFDDREPQLGVRVDDVLADELQVVVAAQVAVAAEVHEAGEVAVAAEPADARGKHAVGSETQIVARVGIDRAAGEEAPDFRRVLVRDARRRSGEGAVLAE